MSNNFFSVLGCIYGLTSVMIGAFATHYLKNKLPPFIFDGQTSPIDIMKTGVLYQSMVSFLLLFLGSLRSQKNDPFKLLYSSCLCFSVGGFLFSFSLYALVLTQIHFFGAITPLGGILLMIGWLSLGIFYLVDARHSGTPPTSPPHSKLDSRT